MFYCASVDTIAQQVTLDAAVFGTGIAKAFDDGGKIKVERVFPGEVLLDDMDSMYGEPRSIYQTRFLDKAVVQATFPDMASRLESSNPSRSDLITQQNNTAD